jgi:four helix bundle protein
MIMSKSIAQEKSYAFALRIVKLYRFLCSEKQEYVLSKACLLAGTRVGAHVKEAQQAGSRAIFHREMSRALRKASETEYWLQLLRDGGYLEERMYDSINADCVELIKILTPIVKKTNE